MRPFKRQPILSMHTYLLQFFSYLSAKESADNAQFVPDTPSNGIIELPDPIEESQVNKMIDAVEYHINSGLYGEDWKMHKRTVFAKVFELKEVSFD